MVRNSLKYVSWKLPNEKIIDLKTIYRTSIRKVALNALDSFYDAQGLKFAETHVVEWSANGLPNGVYFVKLISNKSSQSQKVIILK